MVKAASEQPLPKTATTERRELKAGGEGKAFMAVSCLWEGTSRSKKGEGSVLPHTKQGAS